jgi:phosphatidylinositol kinase/protein kinase (PI-3  family)
MVEKVPVKRAKSAKKTRSSLEVASSAAQLLTQKNELEKFTCNICQEIVDSAKPVRLRACDHLFCQGCISQAGSSGPTKSPKGRS